MASHRKHQRRNTCHHCGKRWVTELQPYQNCGTINQTHCLIFLFYRFCTGETVPVESYRWQFWQPCDVCVKHPVVPLWCGERLHARRPDLVLHQVDPLAKNGLILRGYGRGIIYFVPCRAMPADLYGLHVAVDGVPTNVCGGNHFHYYCRFIVSLVLMLTIYTIKMHYFSLLT